MSARFPRLPARTGTTFVEVARRHGDYAMCGVAAAVTLDDAGAARVLGHRPRLSQRRGQRLLNVDVLAERVVEVLVRVHHRHGDRCDLVQLEQLSIMLSNTGSQGGKLT